MQNLIRCGQSWATYASAYRFAILFAFLFLLCFGKATAQTDIRLSKSILGVDLPTSHTPGNFNVIFELNVQNTGTAPLMDLQITDQLNAISQYGTVFQRVVNPPIIMESDATALPNTNINYNGRSGQSNFFTTGGQLDPGQFIRLEFIVEVDPDAPGADPTVTNQAMVTASDGVMTITDLSDSGRVPNSTNSGALGDTGGHDDPTPLTDCYNRVGNFGCNDEVNLSLNGDCIAVVNPDNLAEGEASDCDDDNYPYGGYYQLEIKTLEGEVIDDLDPSTPNKIEFDAAPYDAVMGNLTNIVTGNRCWVRINLDDKRAPICSPANDVEALIDLDGIDQNNDNNLLDDIDPSGRDDLQDEYILCRLVEENTVEPYFDQLEIDDFTDCSAVDGISTNTLFTEVCSSTDLTDFSVDFSRFDNTKFTISGVYERTWTARDINGLENASSCTQRVFVLRPLPAQVQIDALAETTCTADLQSFFAAANPYFTVAAGSTDIVNGGRGTGITTNRAQRYALDDGFSCGYIVRITQGNTVDLCGGSTKQFRSYSVIDRCTQDQIYRNFQQILKIEDRDAPVFADVPDFVLNTNATTCTATGNVLAARVTDDCSLAQVDRVTIERLFPQTSSSTDNFVGSVENGGRVDGLPMGIGTYRLTYYASDDCGNTSFRTATLEVADNVPPVVICDDELHLTLVSDGEGGQFVRLRADGLNESSYDNCYPVIFRVRSTTNADTTDDEFGEHTTFSCEDLNNTNLTAEMLVIEDRDGDGRYPDDDGGLISSCTGQISLEDKSAPTLVCEDIDINCNDVSLRTLLDPTRADFRAPTFAEGCEGVGAISLSLEILDANYNGNCEAGSFIRRFTATRQLDGFTRSSTCDQLVTVEYVSDWEINFPPDHIINCGSGEEIPAATPVNDLLQNFGCDNWGVEVDEMTFDVVTGGGCQKIIRTYKFINWCTWSPGEAARPGRVNRPTDLILADSNRVSLQHFATGFGRNTLSDQNDRDRFDEEQDAIDRRDNDGALVILDVMPGDTRYDVFGFTDDEEINGRNNVFRVDANNYGHFTYTQIIKVVDDVAPVIQPIADFTIGDRDGNCVESILLPVPTVDDCQPSYTVAYDAGSLGSGTFAGTAPNLQSVTLPNVPIDGVYPITYTVTDGCGNSSTTRFEVRTADETPPTARCVPGLAIDVDANGEAEIWASDFDFDSFDGCSASVRASFADPALFPDSTTFVATCDMLGTNEINLWITDESGNSSVCTTILEIQSDNPQQECNGGSLLRITGNISTEYGEQLEGVAVQLEGTMDDMYYTDVSGAYRFSNIPDGSSVRLQPTLNTNWLNGVTTHDLLLIRKHILGYTELDSPYKMIAADVNRSQHISTLDMLALRKLILGIDSEITESESWRFIDNTYEFSDPTNPWAEAFPELLEVNEVHRNMTANFIAIKMGDMNGSAISSAQTTLTERAVQLAGTLPIDISVRREGPLQYLTFHSDVIDRMEGMQMELEFDTRRVAFEHAQHGVLGQSNINTMHAEEGKLTFSWNIESDVRDINVPLFELVFRVDNKVNWDNILRIDESRIAAEAYVYDQNGVLGFYDLELRNRSAIEEGVVLHQNTPNPFKGRTLIPFDLTEAQSATLTVYTSTGMQLYRVTDHFSAGRNHVEIEWTEKQQQGLMYYTIETATQRITKKMLVLE